MQTDALALYRKYHLERADERLDMFKILAEQYNIERILYPGSFVHVTPSFVFSKATYVDMEQRAKDFFDASALQRYIAERKTYPQAAQVRFYHQDYSTELPECDESFDLLISQCAGFVSTHNKQYLRIGGWLLANNSHGDASMAYLDDDYELVGVIKRRGEKFDHRMDNLADYFIPKKDTPVTKAYLEKTRRGVGYRKSAFAYLFIRTG